MKYRVMKQARTPLSASALILSGALAATPSLCAAQDVVGQEDRGVINWASQDGNFTIGVRGLIQADVTHHDEDSLAMRDGVELNQARIGAMGTLYGEWDYLFLYDSAADTVQEAKIAYTPLTVGGADLRLVFGNQFAPFGLETPQGIQYTTFMGHDPGSLALGAGPRRGGIRADLIDDAWFVSLGLQQGVLGGDGLHQTGPDDPEGDDEVVATAQIGVNPINQPQHLLHLRASAQYTDARDSDRSRVFAPTMSSSSNALLVDTGGFTSDQSIAYGVAANYTNGPFGVVAEWMWRQFDDIGGQNQPDGADPAFQGGYVEASFFLTGESRPFAQGAHYPGSFGPPQPRNPVSEGGMGAWQLAARYGVADLSDDGVEGGEQSLAVAGINWWPEARVRASLNYVNILDVDGGPNDGAEPSFVQARMQLEW